MSEENKKWLEQKLTEATKGLTPAERYLNEEVAHRRKESLACEDIAQREGDRLLKADDKGAETAFRIAALIRRRRDEHLEPF